MMKSKSMILFILSTLLLIALFSASIVSGQQIDPEIAENSDRVEWQPQIEYERAILTVTGPNGYLFQQEFPASVFPYFQAVNPGGEPLAPGSYTYEVQLTPALSADTKAELAAASNDMGRQAIVSELSAAGIIPNPAQLTLSGYLTIQDGKFLTNALEGEFQSNGDISSPDDIAAPDDQVILDDFIIDGSLCVGVDCVNGESFGFDTIRIKENNLRIRAVDTSSTASFPTTDWQITFNESTNGGANKFSIDDIDSGSTPFTIEASAPSHSLYVDDGGRLGFGTSTPVVEAHFRDGDTPTVRLEQDGSSGFSAQTWDVAGNEAGFFIRDVSNGSTLPFRILPGAASASLVVDGDNEVGIGAGTNPSAPLHVERSNGTSNILVEETSGTSAVRSLLNLENFGAPQIQFIDNNANDEWQIGMFTGEKFLINHVGTGGAEFQILNNGTVKMAAGATTTFTLDSAGNLTVAGTVNGTSSRALKENLVATNGEVLELVMDLPVYYYNYIADGEVIRHVGPMSEDFAALFEVGVDDKHISPMDMAGVAIAAVQELYESVEMKSFELRTMQMELTAQQDRIEELEALNADLEARLAALEAIVLGQMEENNSGD